MKNFTSKIYGLPTLIIVILIFAALGAGKIAPDYLPKAGASSITQAIAPLGTPADVAVDGSYAFVASSQYGLVVVDVSDPSNPIGVATTEVGFTPSRIAVAGSLAVLGGGTAGIAVIDISNPVNPVWLSSLGGFYVFDLTVRGSITYVVNGVNVFVIDLQDPSNPVQIASLAVGGAASAIAVAGQYAYVAAAPSMAVLDVSAPDDPYVVGSVSAQCYHVAAQGSYAYIDGEIGGGIQIVDVNDPTAPEIVGHQPIVASFKGLTEENGIVYVVFNRPDFNQTGVQLIDVSIPESPSPV